MEAGLMLEPEPSRKNIQLILADSAADPSDELTTTLQ